MKRVLARSVATLLFLALLPAAAFAQASITGVVKDTSGAVLPGVTVEAASPAIIEKVRTAVTDGAGQYRITELRPGAYTVTFTLPGFNTVKRDGINLTGAFTASVDAELRVGALEETITVSGEAPIVDVQSTTRQRVMDSEVISTLPTGRNMFNLGVLIPGVSISTGGLASQDVGGALGPETRALVAHGGKGGLGNAHFKSSVNRAPRRFIPGEPGEQRMLQLELQVLADVGLLGMPNAGKSTLLRAVSEARPKVADYPFTTLHPQLGVVRVGPERSFVMADIPGLIEGAAEGAGLGIRFLKHLSRTRILLHLVDVAPPDPAADPVRAVKALAAELKKFSKELAKRERWLVLNKIDLLPPDARETLVKQIVKGLRWKGPVFSVSAATGEGCRELAAKLMERLEAVRRQAAEDEQSEAAGLEE